MHADEHLTNQKFLLLGTLVLEYAFEFLPPCLKRIQMGIEGVVKERGFNGWASDQNSIVKQKIKSERKIKR